jgi:dienelactone hydrolase
MFQERVLHTRFNSKGKKATRKISITLGVVINSISAMGADMPTDANNFYKSDSVTVRKVTFTNQYQMRVAGNLFLPRNFDKNTKAAAIVVGHPMGAVKEQSANLYATKLAERGFLTLSLDLSFWGESEGQPRNAVSPDIYAEDFSAAVDFLGTQAFVDRSRIGALGICGSGSFVISAAKIDPRMKAIATVSMYEMGAASRHALRRSQTVEPAQAVHRAGCRATLRGIHGRPARLHQRHGARTHARHAPHPARVLRFLPHAPGRVHTAGFHASTDDASDPDQQRQVHEFLSVQRHRDDFAPTHAVHNG